MPLKLDKRKNSGIWRIRGTHYGVRIDQSARTRVRAEAETIRKQLEKTIFAQVHDLNDPGENYSFADAAEAWLAAGGEVAPFPYFENLFTRLADYRLADLTQGTIDREAVAVMPTQSAATRKRHFYTPVSIILKFAARERMMADFSLERPQVKGRRPNYLTPEKAETLLAAAEDFAPLLTFFIGTGGRTSEIMRAEWRDVSVGGQRITFWNTKKDKPRSIDLCDRTRAALPERGEGRIWRQRNGLPWAENRGRFHGPATRLERLSKSLGWERLGLHALRHTWASWQYAIEPDPLRLMLKGGWSDQKMIENYVHIGSPDLGKSARDHGWFSYTDLGNIRAALK